MQSFFSRIGRSRSLIQNFLRVVNFKFLKYGDNFVGNNSEGQEGSKAGKIG